MNVDKANLKALAEASGLDQWYSAGDLRYCDDKTGEIHGLHHDDSRFIAAASPAMVLALLAEIDRLDRESQNLSNKLGDCDRERRASRAERDQLKVENEALRKLCAEMRDSVECRNLHHRNLEQHEYDEPCKVLARIDAAMAKETSHG